MIMEQRPRRPQFASRLESSSKNANITSAVGIEEPVGRLRARRSSLFTHTVIWITGLICLAFLIGSLVQAWSNSRLMQQLQSSQQQFQQMQAHNKQLSQAANRYQQATVVAKEARQQLGYIRPGERPVVVVGANVQTTTSASHPSKPVQHPPFWQDWWQVFFGK
ncbi:MAG TPA: septum formation initiator family protein [Ktedonobacteraceae bacterium]|jgi:cell division protein FtsB|nr:septum formation initiator family protein [Ktedonobacteraceae bacterium]